MSDAPDSYLFDDERPRFEADDDDVLAAAPDVELSFSESGLRVRSAGAKADFEVPGVDVATAKRAVSAIDGKKTLGEIVRIAGEKARPLLRAGQGVVFFTPAAIEALERALSGTEIVRFPGSPYEITRSYWQNMVAVRAACSRLDAALASTETFREFLIELNVLALTGADGKTLYTPPSPITRRGLAPGSLLTRASETRETPQGTLFVAGPRVNVKLLGGETYHRLLYERAGDPDALAPAREITLGGLDWGRVVRARAESDPDFGDWFCPSRPLSDAHFEALRAALAEALAAADAGEEERAVRACARFHWRFVRLHPFQCANQSPAMNVVNFVLGRALGLGIPHLILDQLALRLTERAYEQVFDTAVQAYLVGGGPITRYRELRARKLRAFALVQALGAAPSIERARAIAAEAGEEARLALIVVE